MEWWLIKLNLSRLVFLFVCFKMLCECVDNIERDFMLASKIAGHSPQGREDLYLANGKEC